MPLNLNESLFTFLEKSPTAFHAVLNTCELLKKAGYKELKETDAWKITPGGKYLVTRNDSSVIAFRLPAGKNLASFRIAASHSDSPVFKIKPAPELESEKAYIRLNVEKYGGMLMAPWFDRPLSVAGRVVVKCGSAKKEGASFRSVFVDIDRDLLMIPSLAIHFDREANSGHEYKVSPELFPLYGEAANKGSFMKLIAKEAGVKEGDILSYDLFVYPRGRGYAWGAKNEFIAASRLDDLQCTFADTQGFIAGEKKQARDADFCAVLAVFDNEEVGSATKQGAGSTFLSDVLSRIAAGLDFSAEGERRLIANSFMISADNAHAVHPAHGEKSDQINRPQMNKGIVIKHSANQKYTTDAVSCAVMKTICEKAGVPCQEFANHSNVQGGSTLGNISNTHVSLNTVDIGLPQLAMHSPWESAGALDTAYLVKAMETFFSVKQIF